MARERQSLQDLIRGRQQSGFVGRREQVIQYQENLVYSVDDERRRFIFNIHGNAGVGKTYLTEQLQRIAVNSGALTAYVNEASSDVIDVMNIITKQFSRTGVRLDDFEKSVNSYNKRRQELESDPNAPDGITTFLTKTAVTIGLHAARDIPVAGSILAPVDPATAAEQINQARVYVARKFRSQTDVRMLLSPADELTRAFVNDLNRVVGERLIALFFDTFERTAPFLDGWLRGLYAGLYGDLPSGLITAISGQLPLNQNLWSDYLSVITDISLEPFSEVEARQFLAGKDITDEQTIDVILNLSGRLPILLATLANVRPQDTADIGDPAGGAVERFLKWEDDPDRRAIAITAALPRTFNQDVLSILAGTHRVRELFAWLCGLPFVVRQAVSWNYHEVVRSAMLRLQRAQSPLEWRDNHTALAEANAQWADHAAEEGERKWRDPGSVAYKREQIYHLLCASPTNNVMRALASAVRAGQIGPASAYQWAEIFSDAGRDTDHVELRQWGQRLLDGIQDSDLTGYFTCLIDLAHLKAEDLAIALEERAIHHENAKRNGEALADLTRAIELKPDSARTIGQRGWIYLDIDNIDEALADFTRVIELDPDLWVAFGGRGTAYSALGRHEEAIADFTHVIELKPDFWAAFSGRGDAYLETHSYDEAIADFTRVIELKPDIWETFARRGEAYSALGRHEEAITDFNRVIEFDPDFVRAIDYRGRTYFLMGLFDEAIADFTRVLELVPGYAWIIGYRGIAHLMRKRYEEAVTDLTRAIELHDNAFDVASGYRGRANLAMGRYNEAIADFTRAIELNPSYDWAFQGRGEAYLAIDCHDEAVSDFTHAIGLNPDLAADLDRYLPPQPEQG